MKVNKRWMRSQRNTMRCSKGAHLVYDQNMKSVEIGVMSGFCAESIEGERGRAFAFDSTTQKNSQGRFHHIGSIVRTKSITRSVLSNNLKPSASKRIRVMRDVERD